MNTLFRPGRLTLTTISCIALTVVIGQVVTSATALSILTQAAIFALFATGVGVLLKQNGMVSFGHAAFFGLSAYCVAIFLQETLLPAELVILISLAATAIFAFVLALVIVRVPGIAFAMLTLAFGQLFYQLTLKSRGLTGGADGISIAWPDTLFGIPTSTLLENSIIFTISWALLILALALLVRLHHSRFGQMTEAIRDNPERATFIGIRPTLPRALIFTLSAVITAAAGILASFNSGFISPDSLHWSVSGTVLMMVVVGGYWNVTGPALGAVIYVVAKDLIGDLSTHWLSLFGLLLIVIVVFTDNGLSGALRSLAARARTPSAPRHP
ncbi:MAG: branched-chain amino acid ABC transporter permease [Burkholderiales bacterium]|uniref:branched-chain amino acid ABC transporter permease n=2 Tax=Castellaniella denitrificans TaxID=56119 RepID=UPI001AD199D9|nr:branched-chain amino acid ABC transporter permease [Burkholderiales bacterium]